jgi:hypothetical protein
MTRIEEDGVYVIKNFKVQDATTYHHVNNELRIIFVFITSVKEVKQLSIMYRKYYFKFALQDQLLERENKII